MASDPVKIEYLLDNKTAEAFARIVADSKQANVATGDLDAEIQRLRRELEELRRRGAVNVEAGFDATKATTEIETLKKRLAELEAEAAKSVQGVEASTRKISASTQRLVPPGLPNAVKTYSGLNLSIQQIARELPSLTMGPQMFFLAISNNLPIFTDALRQARLEYDALTAAGQKATPVWRQVLRSIVSRQTLMVVGITLLVAYGKELTQWVASLFRGNVALASASELQAEVNERMREGADDLAEQIVDYRRLQTEYESVRGNAEATTRFVEENQSAFSDLGFAVRDAADAESAFVRNTDAVLESLRLRMEGEMLLEAARERIAENVKRRMRQERIASGDVTEGDVRNAFFSRGFWSSVLSGKAWSEAWRNRRDGVNMETSLFLAGLEAYKAQLEGEVEAENENVDKIFDMWAEKQAAATARLKKSGLQEADAAGGGRGGGRDGDDIARLMEEAQRDAEDRRLRAMQEGFARRREEARVEFERELHEVAEQRRRLLDAAASARSRGESAPTDAAIDALTSTMSGNVLKHYKNTLAEISREEREASAARLRDEEASWDEFLAEFGNFRERYEATARMYDRRIEEAGSTGAAAMIRAEKQTALAELEAEGSEWARALVDKSAAQLAEMTRQLETQLAQAESIYEDVGASSPVADFLRAEIARLKAQIKRLKQQLKEQGTDDEDGDDEKKDDDRWANMADGFEAIASSARAAADAVEDVDAGLAKSLRTVVDMATGIAQFVTAIQAISTAMSFTNMMSGIVAAIGLIASLVSIFSQVGSDLDSTIAEAREVNEELRIANERARVKTDSDSIFGETLYNNFANNIEAYRRARDAYLETEDAVRRRGDVHIFSREEIDQRVAELNAMGYKTTGRSGELWIDRTWDSAAQSVGQMQVQTQHSTTGFLGIGKREAKYDSLRNLVPELFDENGEIIMDNLREFVDGESKIFQRLSAENQEYLRKMADGWDTYQEALTAVKDYLSSIFGELGDTLTDALVDSFENGTSAAENFGEAVGSMMRTLAKQMMQGLWIQPYLDLAQEQIKELIENPNLSNEERLQEFGRVLEETTDGILEGAPAMKQWWTNLTARLKEQGIDITAGEMSGTTQTGKQGALYTISQDSFSRVEGLVTSIQIHAASADERLGSISEILDESLAAMQALVHNTDSLPEMLRIMERQQRDGTKIR